MGIYVDHVQVVTVEVYDPNLATTRTLRFGTHGFCTSPSDTPANTHVRSRVRQAIDIQRSLFAPRTTKGRSTVAVGDVVLENSDGELDDFVHYAVDGRDITVERGPKNGAYPADFETEFVGTMSGVEVTPSTVLLKLRDRHAVVQIPLQITKYTGVGLGTLEGVAGDLKGKPKPIMWGKVENIAPPCVETAKLIFQVHDAGSVTLQNVYDQGLALTDAGGSYASTTALLDNAGAPAAGHFKIYSGSEGTYFRLGSAPAGLVSCDATQGASAAARTAGQFFVHLLDVRAAMTTGDWSASDVTTIDGDANYVIGYWTDQETEIATVLDLVAESVSASWFVDQLGVFRIQRLAQPSGSPVESFTANSLLRPLARVTPNDPGQGVPDYKTIVRYRKNYAVQVSDIAGAVTQARREFLAKEWREAQATSADVQVEHLLAQQSVEDSLLTVEADAQTEATHRQSLRGVQRDFFEVVVPLTDANAALDLNDVIELFHDRYHLSVVGSEDGALLRILGVAPNAEERELTITAWGPTFSQANWITDEGDYMQTDAGEYLVFEV